MKLEDILELFNNELKNNRYYSMRQLPFYDMEFMSTLVSRLIELYSLYKDGKYGTDILELRKHFLKEAENRKYVKINDGYFLYDFHASLLTNIYKVVLEIKNDKL